MYEIDCNHNFSAGRQMYDDYKTEINFAIMNVAIVTDKLWRLFADVKLTVFTLCSGISK